ncbi:MAG TPA: SMP-30/gluconolactonase/LRE family protein [Pirellulales bacterium]|jgi:D-xylonolactonase|nr:SMP-30/gluconolactonase/LRE family protein [Pirellulales bacterium]
MEPELIADYACQTGERPVWHPLERRLYWTDIPAGRLFRYDPATGEHEPVYEGRPVGGFTVQADGALLLFLDRGTVVTWRDRRIERTIIEEVADDRGTRFNDVTADPEGRVYCGTMSEKDSAGNILRHARLYLLERDGSLRQLLDHVITSNGIGFTPDERSMYYTDTGVRTIWRFDYDRATGAISNRQAFVRVPEVDAEGKPDGLAMDSQGRVWSARWGGSCVVCYTPDGQEQQRIHLPTHQVSCLTFGGPELADMYITTAGGHDKKANGALAGALFRVRAATRGGPEFLSRIGL